MLSLRGRELWCILFWFHLMGASLWSNSTVYPVTVTNYEKCGANVSIQTTNERQLGKSRRWRSSCRRQELSKQIIQSWGGAEVESKGEVKIKEEDKEKRSTKTKMKRHQSLRFLICLLQIILLERKDKERVAKVRKISHYPMQQHENAF